MMNIWSATDNHYLTFQIQKEHSFWSTTASLYFLIVKILSFEVRIEESWWHKQKKIHLVPCLRLIKLCYVKQKQMFFYIRDRLMQGTRKSVMSVFCRLLDPTRGNDDATRGRTKLADFVERFTYTYVTSYYCETCCTNTDLYVTSCCILKRT